MLKVAAIIVNWNQKDLTIDAVKSLLDSDFPNLDIIVVDNGSKDKSAEVLTEQFPTISVIENSSNLGFAEGNNVGIKLALLRKADYLFFLNNDATVYPSAITELVNFLENNPDAGGVSPYILYMHDKSLIWYGGGIVKLWKGKIAHKHLRKRYDSNSHNREETDYLSGCALLARADMISELCGFDKLFGLYSEDVDLSLKIIKNGWKIWVLPEAIVYHCVSVSSGGDVSPFKAYHRGRSAMLLVKRWVKVWQLPTLVIGGIIGSLVISSRLVLTGKHHTAIAIWRGIVRGLIGGRVPQKYALEYPIGDKDA